MKSCKLKVRDDFNFHECIRFLNRNSLECLHHTENNRIYKPLLIDGRPLLITILNSGKDYLQIRFSKDLGRPKADSIKSYVQDWLDTNRDLTEFYQLANGDPVLSNIVDRFKGLRLIGIPDLFESLAWSIIGQQINLTFAYSLKKRLVNNFGTSFQMRGKDYSIFPSPLSIAKLDPGDLRPLQFSQRKAEYLIGIADIISRNKLSKPTLSVLSFEDAREELIKIRGVGNWTANYVMMKCIRSPQAYPIEDVGLHNAIKQILGLDRKPSRDELEQYGRNWGNWSAYATFYLWHSLVQS